MSDIISSGAKESNDEFTNILTFRQLQDTLEKNRDFPEDIVMDLPHLSAADTKGAKVSAWFPTPGSLNFWSSCTAPDGSSVTMRHHHMGTRNAEAPEWNVEGLPVDLTELDTSEKVIKS